ncbi:efflux RND transporter periplasmic adaptor subunit [Rhizobium sp. YIM 134829]|uniref:efflux RND transporter periplasmic adaptor subunit n=1 Tax=Rhizobium sp. YIM 134829 TaxID=3390453 RepID=UPI00397ADFAF
MRIWTQLAVGVVVLAAGGAAFIHFVPAAGPKLVAAGVPQNLVAMLAPSEAEKSDGARGGGERRGQNPGRGNQTPLVVTEAAGTALVNDRLNAIGNGEAILSVTVTPLATGNLTEVLVKSGDQVRQGQVIARLDNEEQKIAVDQAKVALAGAKDKVERNRRLGNAVSIATLREAEFAEQAAELALKMAELDLTRRDIVSPSKGIVGIITVNPGDYVTTASAIAVVDDRSQILVDFWVPERFANKMTVGQDVEAVPVAAQTQTLEGQIFAIDNRIDQASRTLRVRAKLDNPQDALRAGMSFAVTARFPGDVFPTVNPLSVQWSADGSFVWRINGETSERVPVKIVQRNSDKVLVDAPLAKGDLVVTEGVQRLRNGGKVQMANRAAPPEQEVSQAATADVNAGGAR